MSKSESKNPAIPGDESKATPELSAARTVERWTLSGSAMRGYCQITPRLKGEQEVEVVRKSDYDALKSALANILQGDEGKELPGRSTESPVAPEHSFSCWAPFTARYIAPGEYEVHNKGMTVMFYVEGAAFAEWVAHALTEYDKCLDTIDAKPGTEQ